MAVILDMSKAFDRVKWCFIEVAMGKLGFYEKWICLIMHCITIVSNSIIINGSAHGCITPSRGLWQGDPLSPYLFLICAEAFSSLIHNATRSKELDGISICRGCPYVTRLFFANDSLLFCKANSQECYILTEILRKYEAASGQKINTNKSSIFFNHNTPQETKDEMLEILGPMQGSRHTKYLGLPSIIESPKMQSLLKLKKGLVKNCLVGKKRSSLWG